MRKIILQLAVSLDNFIEGPNGEIDWCFTDQDYGMKDFFERIDSLFIGRKSYELMQSMGEDAVPGFPKLKEYVFSNTLSEVKPDAIIVKGNIVEEIQKIKSFPGKDIWLFGGASLISELMNANLVDEIILAIHPVLLGSGKPLFENLKESINLKHVHTTTYNSGLVMISYVVIPV
jgi:dihydrofolate reductase